MQEPLPEKKAQPLTGAGSFFVPTEQQPRDIAFHFRCYEDRNYAEFPEDFILQSLFVAGNKINSHIYIGDLNFLQTLTELKDNSLQDTLLREWLVSAQLQTTNRLDLATSFIFRLNHISKEAENILHLSLAQHEEYLGKVEVNLIELGTVALPERTILINHPETDKENWDAHRKEKFEGFGYKTRFSKTSELSHQTHEMEEIFNVQQHLRNL
jgi:hypothetical protein